MNMENENMIKVDGDIDGCDMIDMLEEQDYRNMNSSEASTSYLWCHDQEKGEQEGFFKN
jgi:hypothetical protein